MADRYDSDFWEPMVRANRAYRGEPYRRNEAPPRPAEERTTAGGVILTFVAAVSAVLVIAGLIYATGMSARHQAAAAASFCEPALFTTGLPCINQFMETRQYEGIVTPAVQQLVSESAAYTASERHNLAAAEAALTAEVSTEQALERSLNALTYTPQSRAASISLITNSASFGGGVPMAAVIFTPQITAAADVLVGDLQALAKLTAEQARSSSLTQLRSFNGRIRAATIAVQSQMQLVHKAVQTPPTASEEPCAPC